MWHFSMQGLPANDVTIKSCELLPHIFSLTPHPLLAEREKGSYFLWHYLFPIKSGPGYSPVHYSVLSGLSYQLEAPIDSPVCSEWQK